MDWDDKRLGRHLKLRDLNVLLTTNSTGAARACRPLDDMKAKAEASKRAMEQK
jgi:hypothetical protein